MPFDEEEDKQSIQSQKIGLKANNYKSMFDNQVKPTQSDLDDKVKKIQDNASNYKIIASELARSFSKVVSDKTLPQNKNLFQIEMEKDLLSKMIQLAIDINNDPYEQEGMGSLSWITLLMKICLSQRDRINKLEYLISQLEKKYKEISKEVDAT